MSDRVDESRLDASGRREILEQFEDWIDTPMLVLSFFWLALVVVELVGGTSELLEVFGTAIGLSSSWSSS